MTRLLLVSFAAALCLSSPAQAQYNSGSTYEPSTPSQTQAERRAEKARKKAEKQAMKEAKMKAESEAMMAKDGTPKDEVTAKSPLYKVGAEKGSVRAMNRLGVTANDAMMDKDPAMVEDTMMKSDGMAAKDSMMAKDSMIGKPTNCPANTTPQDDGTCRLGS